MTARLQEIFAETESARDRLLAVVAALPEDAFGARGANGGWSVGQVVHHLHRMEDLVTSLVARQAVRAREKGIGPDQGGESLVHSLDRFAIEIAADKITAPESVAPGSGLGKGELLPLLRESRARLRKTLDDSADVDLSRLQLPHPVLGRIDMYQWVLFIGKHEVRHLGQIERIMAGG
jgi:uncharacterized damage-inducible protein DinB